MFTPKTDGIDHVNMYSKGKTAFGRFLTNFAYAPFDCVDGHFDSVEGYWYYLSVYNCPRSDELRHVSGYAAKKLGHELRRIYGSTAIPDFEWRIRYAIRAKLAAHPDQIDRSLITLPLAHYYVLGNGAVKNLDQQFGWLTQIVQEELALAIR